MSSDPQLLAPIVAAPDDDAPRLALAAQLTAQGDPRGELIAVQCALATLADDAPGRLALERRELALLREHDLAWRSVAGSQPGQWWRYDRGFPDHLHAQARWFLAAAPALATRVPLTRLHLTALDAGDCARLCALPSLGSLRELELNAHMHGGDIGSAGASLLARAPVLARLRRLALSGHHIGADGLLALVTAPNLPGLTDLAVHAAKLDNKALAAAIADPAFARLRALELEKLACTPAGARRLAKAPTVRGLRRLALVECRLKAAGVQAILDAPGLAALVDLSLRENACGSDEPVCVGPGLAGTLERLDLSLNQLDDRWARAFAAKRPLPALTALDLRSNALTIAGVTALVESANLAALTSLSVAAPSHLVPSRWGAQLGELAQRPAFARLQALNADGTGVTAAALAGLTASPHARDLRRLQLSFNPVGDEGARLLARSEHLTGLEVLDLTDTELGDSGVEALCESTNFTRLHHLELGALELGERGLAALLATRAFPRLRVLTLYTAKDPALRRALESALAVKVDVGDFEESLGLAPPPGWQE